MDTDKMMEKVKWAISNADKLSEQELRIIYEEAINFGKYLPGTERGAFFWKSCLETLSMLVDSQ